MINQKNLRKQILYVHMCGRGAGGGYTKDWQTSIAVRGMPKAFESCAVIGRLGAM